MDGPCYARSGTSLVRQNDHLKYDHSASRPPFWRNAKAADMLSLYIFTLPLLIGKLAGLTGLLTVDEEILRVFWQN